MDQKMSGPRLGVMLAAAFGVLLTAVSTILQATYRERGDFGYTGAADYTVRLALLILCAVCLSLAMVRIALYCLKGGELRVTASKALSWLGFGVLCMVGIEGISLYREFQNSARLLEDAMYLLLTLSMGMTVLVGKAMAEDERKLFVVSTVQAAIPAACVLADLLLFRSSTYRTLNAAYYLLRVSLLVPFALLPVSLKLLATRVTVRVVSAEDAE